MLIGKGLAAVAAAMIAIGACTYGQSVYFTRLNDPPHALAARPPESVEIFQYAQALRPMTEVGVLEVRPAGEPDGVLNRLRLEAARMGCDGLILIHGDVKVHGQRAFEEAPNRAMCVVYSAGPAPASAPAGAPVGPAAAVNSI